MPTMRHLLDTNISAKEREKLSAFEDLTLVQSIVERGEAALDALHEGIRKDNETRPAYGPEVTAASVEAHLHVRQRLPGSKTRRPRF